VKYYLDTSALVKIYHQEQGTDALLPLYAGEQTIYISELSRIEFLATVWRKCREGLIGDDALSIVCARFDEDVAERYRLLRFTSLVIEQAESLLLRYGKAYPFRTLDCLQFAFFTVYRDDHSRGGADL